MPATTIPSVPHYVPAPPTKEDLEWADLPIIDLSKASTPEGRAELAPQVRDAMRTFGFMYVVNHGLTQAQNERIFDIADVPFSQVAEDEKKQFSYDIKATGLYKGYKLRQYWHIDNGVRDQIEHYNSAYLHRTILKQDHPKALQPFLPEVRTFAEYNHYNILHPILRLLARGMELPEDTFVDIHGFDNKGEGWIRFMKYYPRTDEDEQKTKNVWLKGHMGATKQIFPVPVSALQIMSPDGKWRWIKHIDNALVINAGEAMEFLSGGFYKGTIHRVRQPPADQQGYPRLGVFYFALTDDDVVLRPLTQSPVLQRLKKKDAVVEEEVINGVVVKHWN
ncbi:hypothetical protein ONZ51_g11780 [Trametes cubensis]|uniref:Clavaminate synthase-like protein n=1 Tax=Trametes cubensis TaxID=1111947 RepID=A0AAD7TJS7_9APHY|nr:hypothetical protein ONZ51_g11780 [Trametes cubensis]